VTRLTRLLNLRYLRRQPLRSLLAVLGVAGGVSLTVGVLVTAASTTASIRDFGRQIAGPAPIRVMGPDTHGGVTPATLAAVQATPGVASALPVVQTARWTWPRSAQAPAAARAPPEAPTTRRP
jgi:putative ABC transport system permease protein